MGSERTPLESDVSFTESLADDSKAEKLENDPVEIQVGILNEPFELLRTRLEISNSIENPAIGALLINEIPIKQKYEKYKGKVWGFTEGIGKKPLHEVRKMASKAVIFMVISLTENWKMPIGLFFVHNPDIKYFAETIEEALKRLHAINIHIISITLNCISPHLSFALAEELGAEIDRSKLTIQKIKPWFRHPTLYNQKVYIFYDMDIIVDSLKAYWASQRSLLSNKCKVHYHLVAEVKKVFNTEMQSSETDKMYEWFIIGKRLRFNTEHINKTIADAMQYLKDSNHPSFENEGPTIQFIRVLDFISKLSASGQEGEVYPHLSTSNEQEWRPQILNLINYLKFLKTNNETPEHLSTFKVCITGLTISLYSLLQAYQRFCTRKSSTLDHLLLCRFRLTNINENLFEDCMSHSVTALTMFKKMKGFVGKIHTIETTTHHL